MEKFPAQVSVAGGECMFVLEAGFKVGLDVWLGNWVDDDTIYLIE